MYEVNVEVIKSAAERQTIFLRTFQAGEHTVAATHMLNEVAAARVCLLNAKQKATYDTQLRFANPSQPTNPSPIPTTGTPVSPTPRIVPSVSPNIDAVVMRKGKSRPKRVTPIWQRTSIIVPTTLVSLMVIILLVFYIVGGNDDAPLTRPPVVPDRLPVTVNPPNTLVQPRIDSPVPSTTVDNSNNAQGSTTSTVPTVPIISADEAERFAMALENAKIFQLQRKLVDAAAQLQIAKPLAAIPQYQSEYERIDFIQGTLETFKQLTLTAIESYIPGSEIIVETSNVATVVEVTPNTLTLKVNGEVKEYLREDLALAVAMGIAETNFEEGKMKGFMQAAYLLTLPDRQNPFLSKAREYWELGDASLVPGGSFEKYLSDFDDARQTFHASETNPVVDSSGNMKTLGHIVNNSIDMQLVHIEGGTFTMGSPLSESGRQSDEKQHQVTISHDFLMQTTEVTQLQWKAIMGTEPWKGKEFANIGPTNPATYVSWNDAVDFCAALSANEGETYRLPTEAEWEYACRAGGTGAWSFGDDKEALVDSAWFSINSLDAGERFAHPSAKKTPNALGLFDMHGNVYEWCHDLYSPDYYITGQFIDPRGPKLGETRVLRGGSWGNTAELTRSAHRNQDDAVQRHPHDGFRVVRELTSDAKVADNGNSGLAMIPADDDIDLLELTTAMKKIRKALEVRDMETAARELAIAQTLPKTPETTEVFQRLAKMTELLSEFVKNSDEAINGFSPGSEITVAGSTIVSVARVSQTELVIKAGGRLKTYPRSQLSTTLAMGIADTFFPNNEQITSMKAAFIATQQNRTSKDIATAKEWWTLGPQPIESFDLYLTDRYELHDNNTAEAPDNPLVFTIDLAKALPAYRLNIPYSGAVEKSNIEVEFRVTARGSRSFPSESKQQGPVDINQAFNAEILLGQHVTPAAGRIPANSLDLIGDVLVRLSYDPDEKQFNIYVKPKTDVVAGKPDPIALDLSAQKCAERRMTIQQTINRFQLEIPIHRNNVLNLQAELVNKRNDYQSAVRAKDSGSATQIANQMSALDVQRKGQLSNLTSKSNRLPGLLFNLKYLDSLTRDLDDLKHLDIRYKIYQNVDGQKKLIIDGS
jgi:formylglycine-generating enzyme required for sulfatase activity